MKQLLFRMSESERNELKAFCASKGVSLQDFVTKAIEEYRKKWVIQEGGETVSDIRWIKVTVDMFEDSKIEYIRSLPEGDAIIVIWIQLLSIAGQSNFGGYLMVAEGIPYTEQLLSNKLRRQPVLLQFALQTLQALRMINVEDGPFHITNWEKHQNIDGMDKIRDQARKRVAKHRETKKTQLLLQENARSNVTVTLPVTVNVTPCNAIDIEKEKELKDIADSDECGDAFNQFWKLYPSKKGKTVALKTWKKIWKTINMEQIMSGTQSYIEFCKKTDRPYKDGSTFVNGQCWNDDWTFVGNGSSQSGKTGKAARMVEVNIDEEELLSRAYGNPRP